MAGGAVDRKHTSGRRLPNSHLSRVAPPNSPGLGPACSASVLCMTDPAPLRPADPAELSDALSFGLRYDGKRRLRGADEMAARITAEHLLRHLERSGFVILKRPPPDPTPAPEMRPFRPDKGS